MTGNKGFTIIEAVVALTIFSIVSLALTQIVIVSVKNQLKITLTQSLASQTTRSVDYLTKNLRMAKKDITGICTGTLDSNYGVFEDGHEVRFLSYNAIDEEYRCKKINWINNAISIENSSDESSLNFGEANRLTPTSINVNNLEFFVLGDVFEDIFQPRVTIILEINSSGLEASDSLKIETTVSKRQLDL